MTAKLRNLLKSALFFPFESVLPSFLKKRNDQRLLNKFIAFFKAGNEECEGLGGLGPDGSTQGHMGAD